MFGKIFEQIYDSSIAEDWQTRVVFQDMIVLADANGVIDRTPESISRRTNVPLDIVLKAIKQLEGPDPKSRSPKANGARIERLDPHRDWGWRIVNHGKYRNTKGFDKTAYMRSYMRDKRRSKVPDNQQKLDKKSNYVLHSLNAASASVSASEPNRGKEVQEGRGVEIDLPQGFPKSVDDAILRGSGVGCPAPFIATAWNKAVSRGGKDARGNLILSFGHYLSTEWSYEQERIAKSNNQAHGRAVQNSPRKSPPDYSKGF